MNESSFNELWREKDTTDEVNHKEIQLEININEINQNICFYNFTRNPANYLKLNFSENDFVENYHKNFNPNNLLYKKLEVKQNSNQIVELLDIIEEKQNLENSQKSEKSRITRSNKNINGDRLNNTQEKLFLNKDADKEIQQIQTQENKFNEEVKINENFSECNSQIFEISEFNSQNIPYNINSNIIQIPENIEKSLQILKIKNNSQLQKNNNNLNLKMWRPSENSYNDYNYTQNFGNFNYILEESENNNLNYEDFNNIEDLNYNYTHSHPYNDENQNQNDMNCPMVLTNSSENNLQDRFQLFSMKNRKSIINKNESITHISKENISSNIKPISGFENNCKNINQAPQTATKKNITKEFFSQQLKSLGNLQTQSVKNPDLVSIENKFGMNSQNLECPNYDFYSEENLREEMKKYGMKPGSIKFMVKHLKEIWSFINLKKLPQNLKFDLTKFMCPVNEINEQVEINLPYKSCDKKQLNSKTNARQFNDTKKEKIISIIQEDKSLWMKVLRFSKVELKDVKDVLNKKGIIIENEILKEFLSELGVIFNQPR